MSNQDMCSCERTPGANTWRDSKENMGEAGRAGSLWGWWPDWPTGRRKGGRNTQPQCEHSPPPLASLGRGGKLFTLTRFPKRIVYTNRFV